MTSSPRRPTPPADRSARHLLAVVDATPPEGRVPTDVLLEPGNLVEVSDALGAQMFAVVDGEVTFTVRSVEGEQQWRGRLGARGLVRLRS